MSDDLRCPNNPDATFVGGLLKDFLAMNLTTLTNLPGALFIICLLFIFEKQLGNTYAKCFYILGVLLASILYYCIGYTCFKHEDEQDLFLTPVDEKSSQKPSGGKKIGSGGEATEPSTALVPTDYHWDDEQSSNRSKQNSQGNTTTSTSSTNLRPRNGKYNDVSPLLSALIKLIPFRCASTGSFFLYAIGFSVAFFLHLNFQSSNPIDNNSYRLMTYYIGLLFVLFILSTLILKSHTITSGFLSIGGGIVFGILWGVVVAKLIPQQQQTYSPTTTTSTTNSSNGITKCNFSSNAEENDMICQAFRIA